MATDSTAKAKTTGHGKNGDFYHKLFPESFCTGSCYWVYDDPTGQYVPDPDHPGNCGGACRCVPPEALLYKLRRKLGLDPLSTETPCTPPGGSGLTKQQIEATIELLDAIARLRRLVLGLLLIAGGLLGGLIYLWTR